MILKIESVGSIYLYTMDPPPYTEQPVDDTLWNKICRLMPTTGEIILAATFTTSIIENILYDYDPFYNLLTSFGACGASNYIGNLFPRKIKWVPKVGYLIIMGTNIYAKTKISSGHIKK